jgi:hypothetical protein
VGAKAGVPLVSKRLVFETAFLPEMCRALKISKATLYRTLKSAEKARQPSPLTELELYILSCEQLLK